MLKGTYGKNFDQICEKPPEKTKAFLEITF